MKFFIYSRDYVPPEGCTCVPGILWFSETESTNVPAVCDKYGDFPHWCYVSNDESCGQKIQDNEIFYAGCVEKTGTGMMFFAKFFTKFCIKSSFSDLLNFFFHKYKFSKKSKFCFVQIVVRVVKTIY